MTQVLIVLKQTMGGCTVCTQQISMLIMCLQVKQAFKDAADQYVRKFLDNGVPSLFSDLKPLYRYASAVVLL